MEFWAGMEDMSTWGFCWPTYENKTAIKTQTRCSGAAAETAIEAEWASNEGTEVTLGGRDEGDYLLWRRVYTS